MELREYWAVVRRRLWIVIALLLVVLVATLISNKPAPPSYTATLRFIVGVPPEPARGDYYTYDRYYTWLASEYLADDFSEVLKSAAFAADVSSRMATSGDGAGGLDVPVGAISGSTVSEKQHRILSMHITWGDPAQLARISGAATQALQQNGAKYFAQLGEDRARIELIDPPLVTQAPRGLRERLDLPIRLLLALLAGLFLAFLVDYLDDTLRDGNEVERLGLAILGEIPTSGRGWWPPSRWRWLP